MKRFIFIGLVCLLLGGGAYFIINNNNDKKSKSGENPVIVVNAYREPLYDSIEALGTANANESITITATASETISEINFSDGQLVKHGDIIAMLDQREEQAELGVARARLEENRRELTRIESLLKSKAASKREYDERRTLVEVAEREIQGIEARIAERTLRAPFDGILGIRRLSVGALVEPGGLITTLDDVHLIKLDFTIPAMHLASIKRGVAIKARTDAYDSQEFDGSIESVDSRIDPATRSILVRAILPNPESKIVPGMLMQVRILNNERKALVVAEESIIQKQDQQSVLIVNADNKVEERVIQIGTRIPGIVEVVSGINDGEQVIVRGVNRVKQGDTVSIQEHWDTIKPPESVQEKGL